MTHVCQDQRHRKYLRVVDGCEVASADAGAVSVDDSDTKHAGDCRVHRRTVART